MKNFLKIDFRNAGNVESVYHPVPLPLRRLIYFPHSRRRQEILDLLSFDPRINPEIPFPDAESSFFRPSSLPAFPLL